MKDFCKECIWKNHFKNCMCNYKEEWLEEQKIRQEEQSNK